MPQLHVFLLGTPRIECEGEEVKLPHHKAMALLAYLALNPGTHSRERLATLLWPDADPKRAYAYLRNALWQLNQTPVTEWLIADREHVEFRRDEAFWLDVAHVQDLLAACQTHGHAENEVCAACVPMLTEAVETCAACSSGCNFMAGFTLEDSAEFDDWQAFQAARLQERLAGALEHLVHWHSEQTEYAQAIPYAQHWLALDPLHEAVHQHLMQLYAWDGQQNLALRQYQECVRILEEELGVSPSEETTELYEAIRARKLKPPTQTPSAPVTVVRDSPQPSPTVSLPPAQPVVQPSMAETELRTTTPPEGERRMVTALVARIKGATALAEHWDVEAWMELMDHILQILKDEVQRYEGEIDQLRQDGLTVLFGVPIAHEDDPERAILAALAMQEALHQIDDLPETLALQVGIDTGEVVALAGDAERQPNEGTVRGLPLTLAARLAEATAPGTVLVAEPTYRQVAALFDWQALGRLQVQGVREPLALFRALAHKDLPTKGRGIEGLESPLVGRDAEFNALYQAVENVRAGLGGIVTVVGEAGIGKSRLVAELRKSINQKISKSANQISQDADFEILRFADLQWLEGRCLSYATNVAYQVWLDMLHTWLDAAPDADAAAVRATLRAQVARVCPDYVSEVYPFLVRLLSLPPDAETTARLRGVDAEGLQVLTFRAVETLIENAAQRQPLVLVCEDLHWADPTSLALLERLLPLTDRVPLLLLCIMRPVTEHTCWHIKELATRNYRHRYTDLWLEPLSADQSNTLVGNLLHIEDMPPELRARILERAEGNPFFLEEILRSLIEDDAIAYDEGVRCWRATREIDVLAIPDTLHGVLSARIDRLSPPAKRVLQQAAVIGRTFSLRVLEAIITSPPTREGLGERDQLLDPHLVTLQRAQLIRERAHLPEREYIFKHVLTQEAAYNGLLKRERRAIHRQVAETLERLYPERIEDQLGLLAHHWEQAQDAEQAVRYLRRAGEQAAARYANTEAVALFSRALDLLQADRPEERLGLLLAREEIHNLQGARDAQQQDLHDLQEIVTTLADPGARVSVALRRARYAELTGSPSLAMSLLQETLPMLEEIQDMGERARSYMEWGCSMWRNDYTAAQAPLETAIQLAQTAGLKAIEAESLRELGLVFRRQGNLEQATLHFERSLQLSREIENRKLEGMICNALAIVPAETGNDAEAQRYLALGIRLCRETGNRWDEGWGIRQLADVYYYQGAYTAALHHYQQAVSHAIEIQTILMESVALRGVNRVLGDLGQYAEALAYYERVLRDAHRAGNPHLARTALFFVGLYAHYMGDDARAQACFQEILQIRREMGEESEQGEFWMILGHALMGLGQLDEASAAYQRALKVWTRGHGRRLWFQAGPVRVALLKRETAALRAALPHVEEILRCWDADPTLRWVDFERFEMCWTCYRLLQALGDPRASEVLKRAYDLVQAWAAKLQDPEHRRMFLENVAAHRDIVAEWQRVHIVIL